MDFTNSKRILAPTSAGSLKVQDVPNRLAREKSPYLLQHRDNPVDWYPWGDEALERAKRENKPILLSIGYSACHWCHVMEHESFSNPVIAEQMNTSFVCIKVDREERPDLDHIYQNVAMAMTRGGGWPLTVFLTPDLKPFFGGTYYPPADGFGRPGFPRLLSALSEAWEKDQPGIQENARRLVEFIQREEVSPQKPQSTTHEALIQAGEGLIKLIDWTSGGFQGAPKFPCTTSHLYLWRLGQVAPQSRFAEASLKAFEGMASGGIFDQLGGGFHRYSVDDHWGVPHFEKMLYDNALLMRLGAEILLSGKEVPSPRRARIARVLELTVEWLEREMISPDGLFFSAQDADAEGEEGKSFVWTPEQISQLLTPEETQLALRAYRVTPDGNFEESRTVLSWNLSNPTSEEDQLLESARRKLLVARQRRVQPATDTKSLTSWNALMISGLTWTARALEEVGSKEISKTAQKRARSAYAALKGLALQPNGRLFAVVQDGTGRLSGYLDDYAFFAQAALDCARFSDEPQAVSQWVTDAETAMDVLLSHFRDPGADFFFTSDDHEKLIHRTKSTFDAAVPAGCAVAAECLSVLSEVGRPERAATNLLAATEATSALTARALHTPYGHGQSLSAALLAKDGPVALSGPTASREIRTWNLYRKPPVQGGDPDWSWCRRGVCTAGRYLDHL